MKKFIYLFALVFTMSMAFTSCGKYEEEEVEDVNPRLYKAFIEGSWILINEEGYGDFDFDGVMEFFDSKIENDEIRSTVITFDSNSNCKLSSFYDGHYEFAESKTYKYTISVEGILTIYDNKFGGYDKTFKIEKFGERLLKLTHYYNNGYTTFTFKFCEIDYNMF